MNSSVIFENTGEIDLRMVSTFGCCVKESENPIGFFGTGLKYALAVLLRTGHKIFLQSGPRQFEIIQNKETLRGKEFDFVCAKSGEEIIRLGFTTELGKTWEPWMAYRELFCNAKDEKESMITEGALPPSPTAGKTRLIVIGNKLLSEHRCRSRFILERSPDFALGDIEVSLVPSDCFFYKGIKVMKFQNPALFTYNMKGHVELTEDRTVKDPYSVQYLIARSILEYAEIPMLERVLVADHEHFEGFLDFHGWEINPGRDFFSTISKLQKDSLAKINQSALRLWREKGHGFISPRRINMTSVQSHMVEKAIAICEKAGFMLRDEFPILVVETLGEGGTLAMADKAGKQILLAENLLNSDGTKGVVRALIEEYMHLKFNLEDCTREMQNFLFGKMVSLIEELTGEPI